MTHQFSTVYHPHVLVSQLDSDLKKTFNSDLSKQAQEVIFSRKIVKISHPSLTFNAVPVARTLWLGYSLACILIKNYVSLIISMQKFQKQQKRFEL